MYPQIIKEYLENNIINNKISRTGCYTKPFEKFINFCSDNNFKIDNLLSYNLKDIKIAIFNDLPEPRCHCGKSTEFGIDSMNKFYASRCSLACRSIDINYRNKISATKWKLYQDKEWKLTTEAKKVATCLENYGVDYPMQDIDIFERQQSSCFEKDENGLHGYEPFVFGFLKELYPLICLGTEYLKNMV